MQIIPDQSGLNDETEDGLENDELFDSDLPENISDPFDPNQIKVGRKVVPISSIVERIAHNEVDLSPDFQRRARIWDNVRKSRLIESILLRIPLPVFYVAADIDENWKVVDGLQRLTTIYDYVKYKSDESFRLSGLEYLTAYEGASFGELPRSIIRRINETELNVNVIESGTPENVMFNIFRRLNTGGMSLNSQEIRNALHPGPVRQFLIRMADSRAFKQATGGSVRDERMGARELALRFCAFHLSGYERYQDGELDSFLNKAMHRLNLMTDEERDGLRGAFDDAMLRSYQIFGDNAFRKQFYGQTRRSPINRALFESVSVNLLRYDVEEFEILKSARAEIDEDFLGLMENERFVKAISLSTGGRSSVLTRFEMIHSLFESHLP